MLTAGFAIANKCGLDVCLGMSEGCVPAYRCIYLPRSLVY